MKNKKDISIFKIGYKIIPMAFKACPIYFIISTIIAVLHGISQGINTYITQKFFDSITDLVSTGGVLDKVILLALGLGAALIANQILNGAHNLIGEDVADRTVGYIGGKIHEKAGRLDALTFENPSALDDINKADEGAYSSAFFFFLTSNLLTFYLPFFIFMAIYLYSLKPLLALSLLLIFIPVALTQFIRVRVFTKLADESAPIRRQYEYYEKCIVDREYYKETRFLGAFGYFKNLYVSSLRLLNRKTWTAEKKSGLIEIGMKCITLLGYMGVLYLLVNSLVKGDISVGAFGAVFASLVRMFNTMEEIICVFIGRLTGSLGTIRNLIRFLEMPERGGEDIPINGVPGISLKNVSFKYPGAEKKTLSNVNLKINPEETIAIVGENGAGKTTLVNLIIGLYVPDDGKVIFGGVDTARISAKSLYNNISAVFQKYQRYKMNLGENISISDLRDIGKLNDAMLEHAADKADLSLDGEKFKDSYETMLSREFDGVDLSGGQWQRIAIARGFYKANDVIVLDEPTAAIDPIEETKIYKKFSDMAKDKTAIIVTHRLGAAKIADRIVVIDNGEISEIGTHDELMEKDGKYAAMFKSQSKWYIEAQQ